MEAGSSVVKVGEAVTKKFGTLTEYMGGWVIPLRVIDNPSKLIRSQMAEIPKVISALRARGGDACEMGENRDRFEGSLGPI